MPNNQNSDNMGRRDDQGKPEFNLIPSDGLRELGRVFTFGAGKYAPYNWERGMAWSRCYNSLLRHLYAYWDGERNDPETGLHHMAHCAWNALALLVYSLRGVGIDDRKGSENSGSAAGDVFCAPQKIPQSVRDQIARHNNEAAKSELPIDVDEDRLKQIDRPQPVHSITEIKEGVKFKTHNSQDVWEITRLIMSSLNTFAARCGHREEMFHLRAIAEIVS